MSLAEWTPKSILALKDYDGQKLIADLVAGISVGLVGLPLAMAIAISSGLKPEAGLYCAIVAGFLGALLGGTKTQVSGPTGAFVVVVAGVVARHGTQGLFVCTFMAGVILVILGLTGLGTAIKFLPRPVVVGFTNGIAVLLVSTQIKDFFGLNIAQPPSDFMGRIASDVGHFSTLDPSSTAVSVISLLVMIVARKLLPRIPGPIIVLFLGTAIVAFAHLHVETIQSRYGGVPQGIPQFQFPTFSLNNVQGLLSEAVTIAMLGALQSLMSAVVADRMSGDKHNPNLELVAQGIGNIASPMFGGLPSTGALARTVSNIKSGAVTPFAAMFHALVLLLILLVAAPYASKMPLCVLSVILIMTAYNMGEWAEIPHILKLSRSDISVWAVTFFLTVFADLTVAVQVGMILAALLYISKVTRTTTVAKVDGEYLESGKEHALHFHEIPDQVAIYRIHGPFLFGSTDKLQEVVEDIQALPPVVILRLRNMNAIDATGIQAFEELYKELKASNRHVLFCGAREQPLTLMEQSGFITWVGPENICSNVSTALERARDLLKLKDSQLH